MEQGDAGRRRDGEHRGIDEIEAGAGIVDGDHEREPRDPGGVGLPLEPGELGGHARRCHQVFDHVVEAAAVHLPGLAVGLGREALARFQAVVEVDEIERGADPADAGDHVQPAQERLSPQPQNVPHRLPLSAAALTGSDASVPRRRLSVTSKRQRRSDPIRQRDTASDRAKRRRHAVGVVMRRRRSFAPRAKRAKKSRTRSGSAYLGLARRRPTSSRCCSDSVESVEVREPFGKLIHQRGLALVGQASDSGHEGPPASLWSSLHSIYIAMRASPQARNPLPATRWGSAESAEIPSATECCEKARMAWNASAGRAFYLSGHVPRTVQGVCHARAKAVARRLRLHHLLHRHDRL